MLATVTNKGAAARGFATLDRGIVLLEAGASTLLDLAEHLTHRAWVAAGEVLIAPLTDRDAKAARKRLDQEADARAAGQAGALAALADAAGPTKDG